MKNRNKKIGKTLGLFVLGGLLYNGIELLWRRRTHFSMFLVGGAAFLAIGRIYCRFCKRCLMVRCVLSAIAVTVIEFLSGCILNLGLKMKVWNYEKKRFNILGQVCLLYSTLWGILSIPAGWLYRHLLSADGHR